MFPQITCLDRYIRYHVRTYGAKHSLSMFSAYWRMRIAVAESRPAVRRDEMAIDRRHSPDFRVAVLGHVIVAPPTGPPGLPDSGHVARLRQTPPMPRSATHTPQTANSVHSNLTWARRTRSLRPTVAGYVTLPIKAGLSGLPRSQVPDCGYDDLLLSGGPTHPRVTTKG